MPAPAALLIRTAWLQLVIGFGLGGWLYLGKAGVIETAAGALVTAHREVLLIGWLLQLALGVAWWMFPKHPEGSPRGNPLPPTLGWLALNLGVAAVAGAAATNLGVVPLQVGGRVAEASAVLLIGAGLVRRVKPFGR